MLYKALSPITLLHVKKEKKKSVTPLFPTPMPASSMKSEFLMRNSRFSFSVSAKFIVALIVVQRLMHAQGSVYYYLGHRTDFPWKIELHWIGEFLYAK